MEPSFASMPPELSLRWRRIDVTGRETARLTRQRQDWRLAGEAEVVEGGVSTQVGYTIELDVRWRTRAARVEGVSAGRSVRFDLRTDGRGRWTQDGAAVAELQGAIDIDLGFTPATNTLPIRRLGLAVGASAPVRSAWIRFPEFRIEALDQTYAREAERVFRYQAMVDGDRLTARLDVDRFGWVVRYENLWERQESSGDT